MLFVMEYFKAQTVPYIFALMKQQSILMQRPWKVEPQELSIQIKKDSHHNITLFSMCHQYLQKLSLPFNLCVSGQRACPAFWLLSHASIP